MTTTVTLPRPTFALTVFTLVFGLFFASAPVIAAQESLIPDGAPVDIHSGTCDDFVTEPLADAGEIGTANTADGRGRGSLHVRDDGR